MLTPEYRHILRAIHEIGTAAYAANISNYLAAQGITVRQNTISGALQAS